MTRDEPLDLQLPELFSLELLDLLDLDLLEFLCAAISLGADRLGERGRDHG